MIRKRDERKSPERFGDKDVGDLAVLLKVLSQFISRHVLCAAANKDFTIIGTRLQDTQQEPEISHHSATLDGIPSIMIIIWV